MVLAVDFQSQSPMLCFPTMSRIRCYYWLSLFLSETSWLSVGPPMLIYRDLLLYGPLCLVVWLQSCFTPSVYPKCLPHVFFPSPVVVAYPITRSYTVSITCLMRTDTTRTSSWSCYRPSKDCSTKNVSSFQVCSQVEDLQVVLTCYHHVIRWISDHCFLTIIEHHEYPGKGTALAIIHRH